MKRSWNDLVFDAVNTLLTLLLTVIMLYPLYFIVIASFSDPYAVAKGQLSLLPKGFTLDAYRNVFIQRDIWMGYKNTILYTFFGTLYNLALTIPAAYVLSKKDLFGRAVLSWLFFITMYISGGMIPTYILYTKLGLVNTPWALIIGTGVSCYNLIVTRQFFSNAIPDELYEAGDIDGASNFVLFFRIALPLSASIIAVMALYYGVGHWNSYMSAMIYITTKKYFPLQLVLRNILILNESAAFQIEDLGGDAAMAIARQAYMAAAMKYALIFIASAPLLAAYPFVQKYFIKGVMIGSVKG